MLHSGLVRVANHLNDVIHLLGNSPSFPPEFLDSQFVFFLQPEQNLFKFRTQSVWLAR